MLKISSCHGWQLIAVNAWNQYIIYMANLYLNLLTTNWNWTMQQHSQELAGYSIWNLSLLWYPREQTNSNNHDSATQIKNCIAIPFLRQGKKKTMVQFIGVYANPTIRNGSLLQLRQLVNFNWLPFMIGLSYRPLDCAIFINTLKMRYNSIEVCV